MEWMEYQESLCPGCGNPRHESYAPDADYDAEAVRCKACQARETAARKWNVDDNADTAGLYFAVHPADEEVTDG